MTMTANNDYLLKTTKATTFRKFKKSKYDFTS